VRLRGGGGAWTARRHMAGGGEGGSGAGMMRVRGRQAVQHYCMNRRQGRCAGRLTGGALAIVTGGGGLISFEFKFKTILNQVQIVSNFDCSKKDLLGLKKIEIKYGFEEFEKGNNFFHRNFFRFKIYFELKFGEVMVYL
jgi:hypothetical protein